MKKIIVLLLALSFTMSGVADQQTRYHQSLETPDSHPIQPPVKES